MRHLTLVLVTALVLGCSGAESGKDDLSGARIFENPEIERVEAPRDALAIVFVRLVETTQGDRVARCRVSNSSGRSVLGVVLTIKALDASGALVGVSTTSFSGRIEWLAPGATAVRYLGTGIPEEAVSVLVEVDSVTYLKG